MVIKTVCALGFVFLCRMLQRAVLCDLLFAKPENEKLKITNWKCSSAESQFLTLYDASLGNCTLGCDVRKKCSAVNYFRNLRMCELLSNGTFNERQEDVGSCVYIKRKDIFTNYLSDVCQDKCSDHQVCDTELKQCTIKECQPLSVENAEIFGNMVQFGSKCQMKCQSGYAPVGREVYTKCSLTGDWEPKLRCEKLGNIALNRPIMMSSQYDTVSPGSLMVDGVRNTNWPCASTKQSNQPYMIVDLGQVYDIHYLYILNRHNCCLVLSFPADRLHELRVSFGKTENDYIEHIYNPNTIGKDITFILNPSVLAQYVKLVIDDTEEFLTICELEIGGITLY